MATTQLSSHSPLPVLAQLYNESGLKDASAGGLMPSQAHEGVVDLVEELMTMELSLREGELVADVLICVLRQAEKDLCISLSEKLARAENAPLRLLMYVANEAIDIARPVLRNSPVFALRI